VRPGNPRIKLFFLGGWVGFFAVLVGGGLVGGFVAALSGEREASDIASVVAFVLATPFALLWAGSALWWIYDAWESVPERHREAPLLGPVQPAVAMLLFFVPCFNAVWVFLNNLGLAESMNRALEAQGSPTRTNVALVVFACVFNMVPYCNCLIGPALWFAVMLDLDRARGELSKVDAQAIAREF
jgi:hypothetical protein